MEKPNPAKIRYPTHATALTTFNYLGRFKEFKNPQPPGFEPGTPLTKPSMIPTYSTILLRCLETTPKV